MKDVPPSVTRAMMDRESPEPGMTTSELAWHRARAMVEHVGLGMWEALVSASEAMATTSPPAPELALDAREQAKQCEYAFGQVLDGIEHWMEVRPSEELARAVERLELAGHALGRALYEVDGVLRKENFRRRADKSGLSSEA